MCETWVPSITSIISIQSEWFPAHEWAAKTSVCSSLIDSLPWLISSPKRCRIRASVCVWVSESYPSSSSDHEWFPACEWVGEHKCLCFSHRSFSVGVEDPEREGWRSHINKNKTLFFSATTFSVESGQNVLMCFICHLHVQIVSWVQKRCFNPIKTSLFEHI